MILPYRKLFNKSLITSLRNLSTTKALGKNHYEVLGVSRDATQTEIKNAYFKLTKMYHPDKIAATDENLKKFREISEAYEILETDKDLKETGITAEDLHLRDTLRQKVEKASFQEKPKLKTGGKWTEERKKDHSEKMKEYWKRRKEKEKNKKKG